MVFRLQYNQKHYCDQKWSYDNWLGGVGGLRRSRAWCMRRRRDQTRRRLDAAYNADIVQSTPFHELQTLAYTERKRQVSTPFPRPAVFSLIILPKE